MKHPSPPGSLRETTPRGRPPCAAQRRTLEVSRLSTADPSQLILAVSENSHVVHGWGVTGQSLQTSHDTLLAQPRVDSWTTPRMPPWTPTHRAVCSHTGPTGLPLQSPATPTRKLESPRERGRRQTPAASPAHRGAASVQDASLPTASRLQVSASDGGQRGKRGAAGTGVVTGLAGPSQRSRDLRPARRKALRLHIRCCPPPRTEPRPCLPQGHERGTSDPPRQRPAHVHSKANYTHHTKATPAPQPHLYDATQVFLQG